MKSADCFVEDHMSLNETVQCDLAIIHSPSVDAVPAAIHALVDPDLALAAVQIRYPSSQSVVSRHHRAQHTDDGSVAPFDAA